jgi:lipopolysaccharide/colanic/teichoic acid biosynthesis glycosyltransferase
MKANDSVRSRERSGPLELCTAEELRDFVWREWERSLRTGQQFTLVFFEVTGEHRKSRDACTELGRALLGRLRMSDDAGWLTAERLCAVLPSTTAAGGRALQDDIRDELGGRIAIQTHIRSYSPRWDLELAFDGKRDMGFHEFIPKEPIWRRLADVSGALLGTVAAAPVMIFVAMAVKLTSPGPVLFKQRRIGYRGMPFYMYKFRSMTAGASDSIHQQYVRKLINGNADLNHEGCYKLADDPRLTTVGRFIRKWSLDELPQLFNVIKGDMSLVGPRPDPWYAKDDYLPWYYDRALRIKPGITGLWQVEGRSRVSYENMVRMDIRYLKRRSLVSDLWIFLRTFRAVFSRSGAH